MRLWGFVWGEGRGGEWDVTQEREERGTGGFTWRR